MRWAALVLGLVACQPAQQEINAPLGVVLAPNGLNVPGSTLEVGFDRAQVGAEIALTKLMGQPVRRVAPSSFCSLTQIEWANGLITSFSDNAFVGWRLAPTRSLADFAVASAVIQPFAGQNCL